MYQEVEVHRRKKEEEPQTSFQGGGLVRGRACLVREEAGERLPQATDGLRFGLIVCGGAPQSF